MKYLMDRYLTGRLDEIWSCDCSIGHSPAGHNAGTADGLKSAANGINKANEALISSIPYILQQLPALEILEKTNCGRVLRGYEGSRVNYGGLGMRRDRLDFSDKREFENTLSTSDYLRDGGFCFKNGWNNYDADVVV